MSDTELARLTPKPASLQDAIAAHHAAKYYLDYYKRVEKEARYDLADFMCIQEDDYCGQTIIAADGSRIRLEVGTTLDVSNFGDRIQHVMAMVHNPDSGVTDAMIQAFRKVKNNPTVTYNVSGFNNLPDSVREYLEPAITWKQQLTIKYIAKTEDR